jgi:hypothetical protein
MTDEEDDDGSHHYIDLDEDSGESCGSCEGCGTNLYPDDNLRYCEQCLWRRQGGAN